MRWSELPEGARRYILYHTLVSPLLITDYMVPLYMLMTGYSILEVGLLFTAIRVLSIPATYLIGRLFDSLPVRHGLIIIDLLEAVAKLFYSLAHGAIAPLMLLLGLLAEKIAGLFYPLYQVAEKLLYPEDRMEEAYAWHMRLPEASQLLGFLLLGYLFGHVYTTPLDYRLAFLAFAAYSAALAVYLARALPRLDKQARIPQGKTVFRVDKEFRRILLFEALTTLAWSMAPGIVMLYYVVEVLGYTLFEAMIVEAAISVGSILATYASERIPRRHRFKALATGYTLITLWALTMALQPPLPIVVLSYMVARFGDTLAFPFYRAWLLGKVPEDKAGAILAAVSSYRRTLTLASPAIAGLLASINPALPYAASLALFTATTILLAALHYLNK